METQDKDCYVCLAAALHYVECIETIHRFAALIKLKLILTLTFILLFALLIFLFE